MGIPAAGKTPEARRLAERVGATLITTDRIRTDRTIRRAAWLSTLERTATRHITQGDDVIIDACSVQPDQRARWLTLATHLHTPAHLLIIRCPLSVAAARNARRTHPVPGHVLRRYAQQMRQAEHDVITERWDTVEVLSTDERQIGPISSRTVNVEPQPRAMTQW